ncbi:uncharacterized protein LOC110219807 isoform X2 [Phascolarctos cinereus]
MGVKRSLQSAGLSLGLLANILVVLAASTDFWSRFSEGHSGLWRVCRKHNCTNSSCETMLAVTAACVVLAAGSGLVASVLGIRVLQASLNGNLIPPRGRNACLGFFLSALLLLAGMVGYTAREAWKVDSFFSWFYFTAWLALPFSILAVSLDFPPPESLPGKTLVGEVQKGWSDLQYGTGGKGEEKTEPRPLRVTPPPLPGVPARPASFRTRFRTCAKGTVAEGGEDGRGFRPWTLVSVHSTRCVPFALHWRPSLQSSTHLLPSLARGRAPLPKLPRHLVADWGTGCEGRDDLITYFLIGGGRRGCVGRRSVG